MRRRRRDPSHSIQEIFSDMALLMLSFFIFLFVTILITTRLGEEQQLPELEQQVTKLQAELQRSQDSRQRLVQQLDHAASRNVAGQVDQILATAGLHHGQGRKDFEIFVKGLKDLPGNDLHLVVDATGSMHGVTTFLIPVLRVIVMRSGKHLDAITWFSGGEAETYTGSMGEMFDKLMEGAPFIGSNETIGDAFKQAARNIRAPGAYLLIGDEPSDDRIFYLDIKAPVFTLPLGHSNPTTLWEYQTLADKTGGKMLRLEFR
ncbi:MAG: hypothetical protein HY940_02715 [Gammaproteobacteria bacterium]|nr:hypothetical protein [Gammaproteobacteria bacterium]